MPVFNPMLMTRRLACTRGRPRCSALASASIVVMQRVRMGAARVECCSCGGWRQRVCLVCKNDRCAIGADECCDDLCGSLSRMRRYSRSKAQFAVQSRSCRELSGFITLANYRGVLLKEVCRYETGGTRPPPMNRRRAVFLYILLLLYGTIRYHTFGPMLKKNSGRPRHRRDIWLDGVEAHEGPRNMSQDNRTHWLISTQGQTPPNPRRP